MATFLSAQHARNTIRLHWNDAGFAPLPNLLSESVADELGTSSLDTQLGALYVFVDECLGLLRYTTHYFLSGIPDSGQTSALYYRLAVKQLRNLSAVRVLCAAGLDGNARMQLRLLYETSLVWVRVLFDPVFRADFERAIGPKDANTFWHEHMSKGRNEKWLQINLTAQGVTWFGGDNDLVREMKQEMSLSSHPTIWQAIFDAEEDLSDPQDRLVLGSASGASNFTLTMAIFAAAIPFALFPEPDYGLRTVDLSAVRPWPPAHVSNPNWDVYNSKLRLMMPRLLIASVNFSKLLAQSKKPDPSGVAGAPE